MIKLVVSDLDGTLLNPQHKITPRTIHSVQRLVKQGVKFMLATGRHYQDVYLLAQQLQVPMTLITSNGARVHRECGTLIYENHMPSHLVEQVLTLSEGFGIHRNLYQHDLWLVEEEHKDLLALHQESGFQYQLRDFSKIDLDYIDKIYFTADHALLVALQQKLSAALAGQLHITFTSPEYLEIMNFGVSKGQALRSVLQQKNIQPEEVVAIGDGMNDIEMLDLVGVKVIMANATEQVKNCFPAAQIALSNNQEGVADYLERHLLTSL